MLYTVIRTVVWALLLLAIAGSLVFMVSPMLEKEPGWMRRSLIATISLVVAVAMFVASIGVFNGIKIHDATASAREAVVVAMFADGMTKPTTPKQADTTFVIAVSRAETSGNLIIRYRKVFPYEFSVVSSVSHGTNVASACVWFSKANHIWMPMTIPCPSFPLVRTHKKRG